MKHYVTPKLGIVKMPAQDVIMASDGATNQIEGDFVVNANPGWIQLDS